VVLPPDLLVHLQQLAAHLGDDDVDLVAATTAMMVDLQTTITGSAGFSVTVVHAGHPVALTALPPELAGRVVTSLRLPLPRLDPCYERGGRAVFYSTRPGALVDLAADLGHALRPPPAGAPGAVRHPDGGPDRGAGATYDGPGEVELDVDVPPAATTGLTGWRELATVHRAVGMLVEQGHDLDTAHEALRRGASTAGLPTHLFAARLLQR